MIHGTVIVAVVPYFVVPFDTLFVGIFIADCIASFPTIVACIVGSAPAPLLVNTCHAVPTPTLWRAPVVVVPPKTGQYAVKAETPVPPSATGISVPPGAK